jgi:hypothetical protein
MLRSTLEAEDRLLSGSLVTAETLLHLVTAAELDQPRRKWRSKQLEAETATTDSRQS